LENWNPDRDRNDIRESLEGNETAYAQLVLRYQNIIAVQMRRFTRDPNELEELVQDVFVEAYFSLPSYRERAPFLHWLRRIATRRGYRFWKLKATERNKKLSLFENTMETARSIPDDPLPSEAAEYLYRLLERLPTKERLILTLQYFEECSTREIAERMGWNQTLVKVRAFRARKRLRHYLDVAGYGEKHHE